MVKCDFCKTEISGDRNIAYDKNQFPFHSICLEVKNRHD